MPVVFEQTNTKGTRVGIWEIVEPMSFFSEQLQMDTIPDEKLPGRILEKMAVRLLLNYLADATVHTGIQYDAFGKPFLSNYPLFISFSHKKNHVAVIVSPDNPATGIDIEALSPLPLKLSAKFQNTEDLIGIKEENAAFKACLLWSAKECLYKVYGKKELDFSAHMTIRATGKEELLGCIHKNGYKQEVPLYYKKIGAFVLTYTH